MNRQRYAPPPINHALLCEKMLFMYPSHKNTPELIKLLVAEYLKLWQLTLGFDDKRIVTTGCILAVQVAHQELLRGRYFFDCVAYFNRFVTAHEWAWHGHTDVRGTLDTLKAYVEFFNDEPNEPWKEMAEAHSLKKANFTIVN